tara:strand:+ start:3129 stop:4889 length:1761 start_codon:yes stop_codon:yes gene_type:complete
MSGESLTALGGFTTAREKADTITRTWTRWDAMKDPAIVKWREVEAYRYATDTSSLPQGGSAFNHTTHLPIVASIAQDLKAILGQVVLPHEDWFTFEPSDSEAAREEQRKIIVSYLKNRHALNGFVNVIDKLEEDIISTGNCFAQAHHADESRAENAGYVGPKPNRISPYDICFDATAADFANTPKIVREIVSLGELFKRGRDGRLDGDAVTELLLNRHNAASSDGGEDKNEQYVPLGFGTYQEYLIGGFVELLWFYGDVYDGDNNELHESKMIVVADNYVTLLEQDIQTADGRPHIYKGGWQNLPDNLWSQGPLENIIGLNYQINHRENAKSEALDRLIYPDKVYMGDVEEMYDDETDTVTYLAPEGGGVNELAINTQFFSFDLQIDRLQHAARGAARLPSDLTGFRSQGEKTLGEVTALTEGGMRGFVDKAAGFERDVLEPLLKAEIELAHAHFGTAFSVPNKSELGFIEMLNVTQDDLAINGLLIPRGAKRFARKNQLLGSLTQLSGTPLFQIAAPHISAKGVSTMLGELLEVQDDGVFEENAQVIEATEQQQMMDKAEQSTAIAASQAGMEETMLNQEIENLE